MTFDLTEAGDALKYRSAIVENRLVVPSIKTL